MQDSNIPRIKDPVRTNNVWMTVIKIIICAGLLWIVFTRIDINTVFAVMARINPWYFVVAYIIYIIANLFFIIRWKIVLNATGINNRFIRLVGLYYIGCFFNNFLLGAVGGDIIKAYYSGKDTAKTELSFISVFLDRYIGLIALLILITLTSFFVDYQLLGVQFYFFLIPITVIALGITALLSTGFAIYVNRLLGNHMRQVQNFISLANQAFKTVFTRFSLFIWAIICTFAFLLIVSLINYLFVISMGRSIDMGYITLFTFLMALIASIPITINGIGLREITFLYLFSGHGLSPDEAVALALLGFLLVVTFSLPGGIIFLIWRQRSSSA